MNESGRYARSYSTEGPTVEQGARDLAAFALRCGLGPSTRARVGGACSEALDNVVRHAYPGGTGTVRVLATMGERELAVTVRDEGIGIDPGRVDVDRLGGCLDGGLARMCALAEGVRLGAGPGRGTDVHLRFDVRRTLFDEEQLLDLSELDFLTPATARLVLEHLDRADAPERLRLSPALAVAVGRMLAGPDPRRVLQTALWS